MQPGPKNRLTNSVEKIAGAKRQGGTGDHRVLLCRYHCIKHATEPLQRFARQRLDPATQSVAMDRATARAVGTIMPRLLSLRLQGRLKLDQINPARRCAN
jgi:hypothetical protein